MLLLIITFYKLSKVWNHIISEMLQNSKNICFLSRKFEVMQISLLYPTYYYVAP